ncbi:MAG: glycosyltransferase [Frankiaceae bacterium]|nr:glycosyltransferase [Frankiaceae bacterium]
MDSGSAEPGSIAKVADEAGARLIRSDLPGASLARNLGWRAASHELVGFVDDDVRVHRGWADAIVAGFEADGTVEFVTGGVVVPVGQEAAERPVAISSKTVRTRLGPDTQGDLGASANLAVRRRALSDVGGFDERLGPGTWAASAEDLDLFDRLFRLNYLGMFEPRATAEHEQWRSRPQLLSLDWRYGKGMGVRLARLRTWDRPRARRIAKEALVTQGVRSVVQDLRQGYEFGALTVATRTLATVIGMVVGAARRATS